MNWYKRALTPEEFEDKMQRVLGLGKYKPDPSEIKKTKKQETESCHSLDPHCDGGDDGW